MTLDWESRPDAVAATPESNESGEHDAKLVGALEEFLGQIESGRRPDRRLFLAQYPEIAPTLSACLESVEMVRNAAPQFNSREPLRQEP